MGVLTDKFVRAMKGLISKLSRSSSQGILFDLPNDGGELEIVSIKLPSMLDSEDPFLQWYEVQSKKVDQILAQGEEQMLNAKKCQHMINKLREAVDIMLKMICASGRAKGFNCILKDLYRVAMKAFALVKMCGGEDLVVGAVYQLENEESFQELLLELECCYNATCALFHKIQPRYEVRSLDFGNASCVDVDLDRATLKRMLENMEIAPETSDESSKLRKYLLQRLEDLEKVKGGELNTLEFANCGTFEKGKQLGASGGCGLVYESKWLGMTCATKVLNYCEGDSDSDEMTKALLCNEASILAGLNHPNLVKFMGMGVSSDGWSFLMMEKMDKSVASLMKEHIKGDGYGLPLDVAIDIIQQVASGMYYLHDMHVAHRDLKLNDVLWTMLDEDEEYRLNFGGFGNVKLANFGISKIEVGNENLEADNMGTNFYRAPEIMKACGGVKGSYFQADVYSFGIMCAELLHGEVEFEHPYYPIKSFYDNVKSGMRPKLASNCEELNTLIRQCCAFHPFERPTFAEIWKRVMCLKANYLMGEVCLPTCSIDKVNSSEQGEVHSKLYGIDEKVKEVQVCLEGVNTLGIVGMGGIGKSTIAQAIFDAEEGNQKFKKRCLYHIGRLESDEDCFQILQNILEKLDVKAKVKDYVYGRRKLEKVLAENNILLILDDIWDKCHLSNILSQGNLSLFGNSTVIVCSRNWDVIKDYVEKRYDMQPLSNKEMCMKLFTTHCFGDEKGSTPKELYEVGEQIVEACKGLPLSLKVLGAFLRGKERLRSWTRVLQRLKRGRSPQGGIDWRIFEVLNISFDGLEELEKKMFLDICCFFLPDVYGEKLSIDHDCFKLLTYGESALIKAFEMLVHRSLIEVHDGVLQMNNHLRDMGRMIVEWNVHAQHSFTKYIGSRLQHLSIRLLQQMKEEKFDFGKIEGISLRDDASLEKYLMEEVCPNLRILLIQTDLEEVLFNFTRFPSLTTLELCGAQMEKLPKGLENLIHVKTLGLKSCANVKFLPKELAYMSSLTSLDLRKCSKLMTLPKELGNLSALMLLDLNWCSGLLAIPKEFGNLLSLASLNLSGCFKLLALPKELGNLSSLTSLNLSWCFELLVIPKELGNLSSLTSLDLRKCFGLSAIPKELGNLSSLISLDLTGCFELLSIPKELGNLSCLTSLDLSGCSKLSTIPKELENLSSLISLDLSGCSKLSTIPKELGNLSSLTSLDLSGCSKLSIIPKELGNLLSLTSLDLSGCSKLSIIPKELGNLSSLTSLDLIGCSKLSTIPKELGNLSSLTSLDLSGRSKLLAIPKELGNLSSLTSLNLHWCSELLAIPKELGNLLSLTTLDLSWCSKLLAIPKELGNLSSLTSLDLSGCSKLSTIPKELENLSFLTSLDLSGCSKLSIIPKELGNLSSLTSLDLSGCSNLSAIPKELRNLSSLTSLDLSGCSKLSAIPKELENLSSLTSLNLIGCSKLLELLFNILAWFFNQGYRLGVALFNILAWFIGQGYDLGIALVQWFVIRITKQVSPCRNGRVKSTDLTPGRFLGQGCSGIIYETTWSRETHGTPLLVRKAFPAVPAVVFENEAARLVDLDHPNIVKTWGWTVDRRSCSLITEHMKHDLFSVVEKRKEAMEAAAVDPMQLYGRPSLPFPLRDAVNLMLQIALGMQYVHDQNLAHGDLKPNNVLVDSETGSMSVKVADFGMTETKKRSTALASHRARCLQVLKWKAPELFEGLLGSSTDNPDNMWTETFRYSAVLESAGSKMQEADIYSFALTCSYILGALPCSSNLGLFELRQGIASGARPHLPDECPKMLESMILACWINDPSRRPRFKDICKDLQAVEWDLRQREDKMKGKMLENLASKPQGLRRDTRLRV